MSYHVSYTNLVKVLKSWKEMPVGLLAYQIDSTVSVITPMLQQLEQVRVVKLDAEKKNVKLCKSTTMPTLAELYALLDN
jgi:hypothetical protein